MEWNNFESSAGIVFQLERDKDIRNRTYGEDAKITPTWVKTLPRPVWHEGQTVLQITPNRVVWKNEVYALEGYKLREKENKNRTYGEDIENLFVQVENLPRPVWYEGQKIFKITPEKMCWRENTYVKVSHFFADTPVVEENQKKFTKKFSIAKNLAKHRAKKMAIMAAVAVPIIILAVILLK